MGIQLFTLAFRIMALPSLLFSVAASADSFITVTETISPNNTISYPRLLEGSVPKFEEINENLRVYLKSSACDIEGDDNYSEATTTVVGLNQDYVGFQNQFDSYCGGAHPNHGVEFITFSSTSGRMINIDQEIPCQAWDEDPESKVCQSENQQTEYRRAIARLIVDHAAPSYLSGPESCYDEDMQKDPSSIVEYMTEVGFTRISGLATRTTGKPVVLQVQYPHVMGACDYEVRVPFSEVSKYFRGDSIIRKWLK